MTRPATTRTARREIERHLIDTPAGEPPEGLLERLRADVPERPEIGTPPPARPMAALRRPLAAAAVVVLAVGGAWVLWRLSGQVLAPERRAATAGAVAADGPRDAEGERAGGDEGFAGRAPEESAAGGPLAGESDATAGAEVVQDAAAAGSGSLDLIGGPEARSGGGAGRPRADDPAAPAPETSQTNPFDERAGAVASEAPPRPEMAAPAAEERARRQAPGGEGTSAAPAAGGGASPPPPAGTLPRRGEPTEERLSAGGAPPPLPARPPRRRETPPREPEVAKAAAAAPAPVPAYARLDDRIEVTVLDGALRRAGIEVTLLQPDGARRRALTDDRGMARFDDVAPGRYRVLVRQGADEKPAVVALEVTGVRGTTTPVLVQVGATATAPLQVAVVGEGGGPLPGATVSVAPGSVPPRATGAEGRVDLDVPPGRYQVIASLEGFAQVSKEVEVPPAGAEPARVELQLPLASVAEEIVVTGEASPISSTATGATTVVMGGSRRAARPRVIPPPPSAKVAEPAAPRHVPAAAEESVGRVVRQVPGATGGPAAPDDAPYADMSFRDYGVHPFVDTAVDRLSTFGLDVDTGSWGLVQGYLRRGHRPPAEAVRVEEVVNAFDYGDPAPARGETFRVTAEGAPTPFAPGPEYRLLRFGIRARSIDPALRRPATLVFVVDVSGSMAQGGRLELVKEALGLLLDRLGDGDRVAVVAFSDEARVVLEPTGDRQAARRAIAGLATEGSTNAEAGLALGYRLAWRDRRPGTATRVLLLSDGVANVGATGAESILARAAGAAADGIELTTVGVGMGNYNDVLLEQLADRGDGRYAYVDDVAAARRIFVDELTGTLETVAEEARVQVDFDPRVVERWRLLGYENRDIADDRFRHDHSVDAGEIGAGHAVTALYEVRLAGEPPPSVPLAHLKLRWRDPESGRFREAERMLRVADLAATWEAAPRSLRLAAAAAEFAEQLRASEWAEDADPADLARHAAAAVADFPGDERAAELAALAARAARLAGRPGRE